MRFRICRSSDSCINFNKTPPCKNAIIVEKQEPIVYWIRDENNKRIQWDTGKTRIIKHWEVDINTLEELLELTEYYLAHEEERIAIAKCGTEKVLREYNFAEKLRRIFDGRNF